jgi:hypothetical protein
MNIGSVVSEFRGDELWVGFRCWGCGKFMDWKKVNNIKNDNIKSNKTK